MDGPRKAVFGHLPLSSGATVGKAPYLLASVYSSLREKMELDDLEGLCLLRKAMDVKSRTKIVEEYSDPYSDPLGRNFCLSEGFSVT